MMALTGAGTAAPPAAARIAFRVKPISDPASGKLSTNSSIGLQRSNSWKRSVSARPS